MTLPPHHFHYDASTRTLHWWGGEQVQQPGKMLVAIIVATSCKAERTMIIKAN